MDRVGDNSEIRGTNVSVGVDVLIATLGVLFNSVT